MCNSRCTNYDVTQDKCNLIEMNTHAAIEELMNASDDKLANFLLNNRCDGDFYTMYKSATEKDYD